MTTRTTLWSTSAAIALAAVSLAASAQNGNAATAAIEQAAAALGGRERLLAVRTLRIEGYGQTAQQNGGGNVTASPEAPQKYQRVNAFQRSVDFENGRVRVEQRVAQDFVFAISSFMKGRLIIQALDGDVPYNVDAQGRATRAPDATARARRIDGLNNPLAIVREALDSRTRLTNLRSEGGLRLVDIRTAQGDELTLALDATTHLPAWLSWVAPDTNLGDVTYRTAYTGYQPIQGLMLPMGYRTTMDFRNLVQSLLHVDRYVIDAPADLAAPEDVRRAPAPVPPQPTATATRVADGVWFIQGSGANSVLFEFSDHLTLFEAYGNEALTLAIIAAARAAVPNKPLTEVIVSHHHFDHSGGLRAAIGEGLTVITHRGNVELFRELASRPATRFPDHLARNPKPLRIVAVDDHLELKDDALEVDIYRVVSNSHMPDAVFAHVPRHRLVAQADLFDFNWDAYWWGNSYMDNLRHRGVEADQDLPVHGKMMPLTEVMALIRKQVANAQALCKEVDAAGLFLQGCPVRNTL